MGEQPDYSLTLLAPILYLRGPLHIVSPSQYATMPMKATVFSGCYPWPFDYSIVLVIVPNTVVIRSFYLLTLDNLRNGDASGGNY